MKNHHFFWFFFYNLAVIPTLFMGLQIARIFNRKVHQGIVERRGLFRRLNEANGVLSDGRQIIVIHCASAGEFEAARPVLTALRSRLPQVKIHVTCYSPSGLKPISEAEGVDSYSYLPFDDPISARRFFRVLKPIAFIIVKHDIWPNMVWMASFRKIPIFWINANLHEKSKRLGWFSRGLNRAFLSQLQAILTVDDSHAVRLAKLVSPDRIFVVGDSRYDRTKERMEQSRLDSDEILLPSWWKGKRVILGGSTWGPDQRVLIPAFAALKRDYPDLFLILVPHEPHQDFLADTEYYLRGFGLNPIRYSQLGDHPSVADTLLVDKIGILALLYRSAWVAYVGGAFGEGVHSVLEPAVFGIPLFFGPRYYMSHEAQFLVQRGAAVSVTASDQLETWLRCYLQDDDAWRKAASESTRLVNAGLGAASRIVDQLTEFVNHPQGN